MPCLPPWQWGRAVCFRCCHQWLSEYSKMKVNRESPTKNEIILVGRGTTQIIGSFAQMLVLPKIVGKPPKSSILIAYSIIFTIHFGVPLFLDISIYDQICVFFWGGTLILIHGCINDFPLCNSMVVELVPLKGGIGSI